LCASPIPFGLTTALTGNLALLGTQARNGVEFLSMKSTPMGE
jgi:branched-chain amino acid transport system substrate-binding protein